MNKQVDDKASTDLERTERQELKVIPFPLARSRERSRRLTQKSARPDQNWSRQLNEDFRDWCRSANPWARLPLVGWGLFCLFHIWNKEFIWWNPFQYFDLGIHELGHWTTMGAGLDISIAMGTLSQWSLPLVVAFAFFRSREYFGVTFCFSWLALSVFHSSWYCGTATESGLVIGQIGESELYHDWNYMLSKIGLLDYDFVVSRYLWNISLLLATFSILSGTWVIRQIFVERKS